MRNLYFPLFPVFFSPITIWKAFTGLKEPHPLTVTQQHPPRHLFPFIGEVLDKCSSYFAFSMWKTVYLMEKTLETYFNVV